MTRWASSARQRFNHDKADVLADLTASHRVPLSSDEEPNEPCYFRKPWSAWTIQRRRRTCALLTS